MLTQLIYNTGVVKSIIENLPKVARRSHLIVYTPNCFALREGQRRLPLLPLVLSN